MPLPLIVVPAVVTTIGGYFAGKEILYWAGTALKATFALVAVTVYVVFIYFFINGIEDVYYLIKEFIEYIQSGSGSDSSTSSFMSNFFGLLNCVGFLDGVSSVKGVILSAISWRLVSNLTVRFTIFTYITYGTITKVISK